MARRHLSAAHRAAISAGLKKKGSRGSSRGRNAIPKRPQMQVWPKNRNKFSKPVSVNRPPKSASTRFRIKKASTR